MPCIFDIKTEDRHCQYCTATICDERQQKPIKHIQQIKLNNMTDREIIRAEIERRIQECKDSKIDSSYYDGLIFAFEEVRDFINSLPEEPVSEDLDMAAKEYAKAKHQNEALIDIVSMDFKAGARWQKEKIINKACDWLWEYTFDDNLIKGFRTNMED